MNNQIYEIAGVLIGKDIKLKDLKGMGFGPAGPVGSWAIAWDHYALAGDALVASTLDGNGFADIKGVKIGPESTVHELMSALGK